MMRYAQTKNDIKCFIGNIEMSGRHFLESTGPFSAAICNVIRIRIDPEIIIARQTVTTAAAAYIGIFSRIEPFVFALNERTQWVRNIACRQAMCVREEFLDLVEEPSGLHPAAEVTSAAVSMDRLAFALAPVAYRTIYCGVPVWSR